MKIAAVQKGIRHTARDGSPMAVSGGESLIVNLLKEIEVILYQAV